MPGWCAVCAGHELWEAERDRAMLSAGGCPSQGSGDDDDEEEDDDVRPRRGKKGGGNPMRLAAVAERPEKAAQGGAGGRILGLGQYLAQKDGEAGGGSGGEDDWD